MRHLVSIAICLLAVLNNPCFGFAILNGEKGNNYFARRSIAVS